MAILTLNVGVILGRHIDDAVREAYELALHLRLGYVTFEANGERWTVYPDGRAFAHTPNGINARWTISNGLIRDNLARVVPISETTTE